MASTIISTSNEVVDSKVDSAEFTWQDLFSEDPQLIPHDDDDDHPCGGRPDGSWYKYRTKVAHTLHNTKVQVVIIGLVVCDALIVIMELLMEIGVLGEDAKHHRAVHDLHHASIAILTAFMVELILKVVCCGPYYFWRQKFELFDAIVVTASWVLDLIFQESAMETALALLIILRLWRVIRIVNAVVASVKKHVAQRNAAAELRISQLQTRVTDLEKLLRHHQIPLPLTPSDHTI